MSRHTRIILLVLLGTSLLSAAALVAWQLRRLARSFYTDGATIREAASSAAARTILWLPPEALPPSVNGPGDEHEPWFADAGRTLYLARRSAGDDADILAAEWSDRDGWMEVRTIDGLNSEADDLGPVLSPDGERLYFSSNRSGSRGGQDLWLVRREGEGWSAAENLGPGVNSEHDEFGPALAPDGRTIYFASNRPLAHDETGRAGDGASAATRANREATDENLFAAPIDGDGFGPAMPLATLNSVHDERSPAISPVGDFLYFASNRPGGAGGFDLYRSRVRGDQLLPPEPLGTAINTEANEVDPAPSLGGFAMHFGSDRGGRGPPPATASTGPKAAANYDLYHTASREVFIEVDTDWARFAAEVLWPALWALLWGLLCLLAVLALLAVLREGRLRQLNLLTRCLLASLLVHFVLMFVFMLWQVGSGMVTAWERAGAVQVSLGASSGGQGLAPQIRGEVAQVELASLPPRFASRAEAPSEIEVPEALVHVDMPMLDPQQIGDRMRSIEPQAAEAPGAPRPPPMVVPSIEPERELVIRTPESAPASEESEAFPAPAARSDPMQASRGSAPALSLRQVVAATPRVHVELDPMAPQVDHAGNLHAARDIAAFAPLPAQQHAMPTPRSRLTPDLAASTFDLLLPEDERQGDSATGEAAASLPRHDELVTRRADAAGRPAVAVTSAVVQVAPGAIEPDVAIQTVQPVIGQVPDAPRGPSGPILPRAHLEPPIGGPALPALREPAAHDERGHPGIEPQPVIEPARPVAVGRVRQWPLAAHGPAIERDASSPDVPMPASGVEVVQAAVDLRPADAPLPSGFRQPREESLAAVAPDRSWAEIRLPQETAPPDPYRQRAPEHREEVAKRMGGSEATERAVNLALRWLAAHQSPDGRWDADRFDDPCGKCGGEATFDADIATTGLALLCFLGAGHTHDADGEYRSVVAGGVEWLRAQQGADGDLRGLETMYSHGIAAIALSEAFGMTRDRALRGPVERAVAFIVRASEPPEVGWRYEPGQAGDTSVLGWQVMALVSARRAGIDVPEEALDGARAYLDRAAEGGHPGLYAYQPHQRPTHSMTAEAMFAQQLLGRARTEERMGASADFLVTSLPHWRSRPNTYYWYYATLALFQHQGAHWQRWNKVLTDQLISSQETDGSEAGSWDPLDRWSRIGGRVYQTAMCTLSLEVYYRYLPLYALDVGD